MAQNNLYPIFLKLDTLHTLIVGGGNVGLEKIQGLLKNSPAARITLVAKSIRTEIYELASQATAVTLEERDFVLNDLDEKDLVILATDNRDLHQRIKELARTRKLLVNVADTPDLCDFYLGGVVSKGNLKLGISTNGKSPTTAKRIREYFEDVLPDELDDLVVAMHTLRSRMKGDLKSKVEALNKITAGWIMDKSS